MFACNGILFNHESPGTRGKTSLPERSRAHWPESNLDCKKQVYLGNLDANEIGDTLVTTWKLNG